LKAEALLLPGGPQAILMDYLAVDLPSGRDNPDYLPSRRLLYIASGKTSTLSVFAVSPKGALEKIASAETAPGCKVVAVDAKGTAFLPDSAGGRLLVVKAPP
jgi:hypothetical protein